MLKVTNTQKYQTYSTATNYILFILQSNSRRHARWRAAERHGDRLPYMLCFKTSCVQSILLECLFPYKIFFWLKDFCSADLFMKKYCVFDTLSMCYILWAFTILWPFCLILSNWFIIKSCYLIVWFINTATLACPTLFFLLFWHCNSLF